MTDAQPFAPDWVSPPGDTIAEVLEERELSPGQFAELLAAPVTFVEELLNGRGVIDDEMAGRLSKILGGSANFWIARESQYREAVSVRHSAVKGDAERDWISTIPVGELRKMGWLGGGTSLEERYDHCLRFFGVANAEEWKKKYSTLITTVALRTSQTFESEPGAVAAWLRRGEVVADAIECEKWNPEKLASSLGEIRRLTRISDRERFFARLQEICASCGVAVVVVKAPKDCKASGAVRFLSPNKAMIILSARHRSDDHFWFTFFHEVGHLLLHGGKGDFVDMDHKSTTKEEMEANRFSQETLIPPSQWDTFLATKITTESIIRFAGKVGVSAGIVVGQLHYVERVGRGAFNSLRRFFDWP